MSRHRPGWWVVPVTVVLGFVAACGARDGAPPAAGGAVQADARLVASVSDVDLDREPAYGTAVPPLPRYLVTTAALVVVATADGEPPQVSARVLTSDQLRALASALDAAGLTTRPVRDEAPGAGPAVQFVVVNEDGSTVVTRRPVAALSVDERAILDDLARWSTRGEAIRMDAGVVATATLPPAAADGEPAWPARTRPLVDGECVEVRGTEGEAVLEAVAPTAWGADGYATPRFVHDGRLYDVRLRPMLPSERPCPEPPPTPVS